jgi:hypothetical protein
MSKKKVTDHILAGPDMVSVLHMFSGLDEASQENSTNKSDVDILHEKLANIKST